jgi:hypothetical protein
MLSFLHSSNCAVTTEEKLRSLKRCSFLSTRVQKAQGILLSSP